MVKGPQGGYYNPIHFPRYYPSLYPKTLTMTAGAPSKKVFLQTFGCQMNEYDSEKMMEQLRSQQYEPVGRADEADLVLLNTCAIREKAENKVYSLLGELAPLKQTNPNLKIGVGGCVAQQNGEAILKGSRGVDFVFGTDNLFELPSMLEAVAQGERVARLGWADHKRKVDTFIPQFEVPPAGQVKAQIAIMKGCNNFCSFCVVPHTRGREVSRPAEDILAEARQQVEAGTREITLLGQNVNSYQANGVDFADLLALMNEIPGLLRIRYTSPHPKDFNQKVAEAHRDLPKVCEQLHLPFQAGSDRILSAMRRRHTVAEYMEKIGMIRSIVPNMALSTDIIVGFPGETEEDFLGTLKVVEDVGFDQIYSFKYSPRSGTPAATMENQVPEAEKAERLARLNALNDQLVEQQLNDLVGSTQEVLLEGPHPKDEGAINGRTRQYRPVTVVNCTAKPGDLVRVDVASRRRFSLVGTLIGSTSII